MDQQQQWQDWVRQAQQGDRQAYHQFLGAVYPYIKNIIRRKLGSQFVDVDDVTQECLIGLHHSLATYHPSRQLKPWLHAIVRYKIADYFRKNNKISQHESFDENNLVTNESVSANTTIEAGLQTSQQASEQIGTILESLPPEQQRAIRLTKLEGLDYSDAAQQEGVSEATLRKRISRAFQAIMRQLERED